MFISIRSNSETMISPGLILILVMIFIGGSNNIVNARCTGTCDTLNLPYPFGFSHDCPIQFNCSRSGLATIGDFPVQNLTVDSIFVSIPHDCNRMIEDMEPLFGELYAPSPENSFLMANCTRPTDGCSIKMKFLETQLKIKSCDATSNISCLTLERTTKFIGMEKWRQSSCRVLFSSIAFESVDVSADESVGIALEFERLRLSWWLKGGCRNVSCSKNAVCTQVDTPGGNLGHRCSCPEGHHGDGFIHPCRKGNSIPCGLTNDGSCVEDEETVFDLVGFYWSLTVTYVIVFVGFLVLLSFESPLRQAWLSLVDNFIHVARRTFGN